MANAQRKTKNPGPPSLDWTRKNEGGGAHNTYRATSPTGWTYAVDRSGRYGPWVLCGWTPQSRFGLYREQPTLTDCQLMAEAHARGEVV